MSVLNRTILVGALGYFVDIYDLVLFSIVRIPSLRTIGVPEDQLLEQGVTLLNYQMGGLLTGGLLWGILGDKRGRISVLFGSIFLYSVANIANAFVTDMPTYGLWRFIAGVGLAGELGTAITLVSETMPKDKRGYGTMWVTGVGLFGGVVAGWMGDKVAWQTAYLMGGILGLMLLILRVGMLESGMYHKLSGKSIRKGDARMLVSNGPRFLKYISCIFIGIPIWFVAGILITFSPELTQALGVRGPIVASKSVMVSYSGLVIGDFICGALSQILKSRKKSVVGCILALSVFVLLYLTSRGLSSSHFYWIVFLLGLGTGYWVVFVTVASEQFGTNLRATVATSVPNFVRGSVIPMTLAFKWLASHVGLIQSAFLVGGISIGLALLSLCHLQETYGKELDYVE